MEKLKNFIPKHTYSINESFSNDLDYIIELNDNRNEKIDIHQIFENNYENVRNNFPSNTLNKKEIFRTYDYSFYQLKSNNFKETDYLKRAQFYFSVYFSLNNKLNKKFMEITKNRKINKYKYKYTIDFSNTNFKEEEKKKEFYFLYDNINYKIKKEKNKNTNISFCSDDEQSNEIIIDNINLNSSNCSSKKDDNNENNDDIDINKNILIGQKRKSNYDIENKKYKQIYKETNFKNIHNNFISNNNVLQKNEDEKLAKFNNLNYNIKSESNYYNFYERNQSDLEFDKKNFNEKTLPKKEEMKYIVKNPSKELLKRKSNDKEFQNFHKNLNDYLYKIIDEKRKKIFFSQVLDESRDIIKNLFTSKKIIPPNKKIPIFRNNYLELSLITKNNGMIKKQILYIK